MLVYSISLSPPPLFIGYDFTHSYFCGTEPRWLTYLQKIGYCLREHKISPSLEMTCCLVAIPHDSFGGNLQIGISVMVVVILFINSLSFFGPATARLNSSLFVLSPIMTNPSLAQSSRHGLTEPLVFHLSTELFIVIPR